jgi:peptide/nickel transport system substrate-binding protein
MTDSNSGPNRRRFLQAAGTITLASFAGCSGSENPSSDGTEGEQYDKEQEGEQVEMNGFSVPADAVVDPSELSSEQDVGEIELIVNPPKSQPNDYDTSKAFAKQASQLGFDMKVVTMPWPKQSDTVWFGKEWDATFWQMVGRPSRLDPDEFLMQMFDSGFQAGYNYYFWEDDQGEYDDLVRAQREERDRDKRQELVHQCQRIIHERGPSTFVMYPKIVRAWNADKWDGFVDLSGMGVRNMISLTNAEPKTDSEELVMSFDQELQYINPFNQSGEVDMVQHRLLWDRLVWPDEKAAPSPRLAKELNWVDDTTLEVPFREDGSFHNGDPITAEDVKFSFDVHQEFSTYFSAPLKPVNSVETVDEHTVRFNFEYHFAPFPLAGLGRIAIVPKQKWRDIIDNKMDVENPMLYQEDTPLGSGPLQFDRWEQGSEVRLTKYGDHWDPIEYEGFTTRIIPSVQTMLTQLQQGAVDITGNFRGDKDVLEETVSGDDSLEMKATTTVGFKQLSYNNDMPPMQIDEFRRAMHHAFDPELSTQQIYSGWGEHDGHAPTSTALDFWHNGDLEPYETSLQAAADKLVEAGFKWDSENNRLHMPADRTELKDSEVSDSKPEGEEQA